MKKNFITALALTACLTLSFVSTTFAAEAWTTVTKDGNNVYHKTGAKLGYNWVYTVTAEDFGYSKTTATTDYIRTLAQRTMTSYWSTDVTP
ncbi:hypothetical protein [Eisenbergiella sp.]